MIRPSKPPLGPLGAVEILQRVVHRFDRMSPDRQTEVMGLMNDLLPANEDSRAMADHLRRLVEGSWLNLTGWSSQPLPSLFGNLESLRSSLEGGLLTSNVSKADGAILETLDWIARGSERRHPLASNVALLPSIETWMKAPVNLARTPHLNARLDVTAEVQWLENRIVDAIDFRKEEHPTVLLLGPGISMTDPLYALRFLYKLGKKAGRPGRLIVYDLEDRPEIRDYYARLPLGPHQMRLCLGNREGNFLNIVGAGAQLILMFHPNIEIGTGGEIDEETEGPHLDIDLIRRILIDHGNLGRGGLFVLQTDLFANIRRDNLKRMLEDFVKRLGPGLQPFLPPRYSALFRTRYINVEGPRDVVLNFQRSAL